MITSTSLLITFLLFGLPLLLVMALAAYFFSLMSTRLKKLQRRQEEIAERLQQTERGYR